MQPSKVTAAFNAPPPSPTELSKAVSQLLGAAPKPVMNAKEREWASLRAQAIRYELLANDGRYSDNRVTAVKNQSEMVPHPLVWAVIPLVQKDQAKVFGSVEDPQTAQLTQQLIRSLPLGKDGEMIDVMLLPMHWEEARTVQEHFPDVTVIKDGEVFRGASPRSLFIGPDATHIPRLVEGLSSCSLKMHLSAETYERLGGLGGSRDIGFIKARSSVVLDHLIHEVQPHLSPYVVIQPEAQSVAVRLGDVDESMELGFILRRLTTEEGIPAFSLYSPTTEPLPHVKAAPDVISLRTTSGSTERCLAVEAIKHAMGKNPGLEKKEAFIKLFADPVYDVAFSLAAQGMTMELHPQNFLMSFNTDTGLTDKIIIRDLHGIDYCQPWRESHGLPDLLSLTHLKKAFPDITQEELDAFFGAHPERHAAPGLFVKALDFFTAMFFYHLLDSVYQEGFFSKKEIDQLVEMIKDSMEKAAERWNFDLDQLPPPRGKAGNFWVAEKKGIRGRTLFRRAHPLT